jgi:hypothetical protein
MNLKYTADEYLNAGLFSDNVADEGVELHTKAFVKCAKGYSCVECGGVICKGDFALSERLLFDGKWHCAYTCVACLDEWLDLVKGVEG